MLYSQNQVYREQFLRIDYGKNFTEYILLKSCRQSGYEEIFSDEPKINYSNSNDIERIELSRIKHKIKEYSLCNDFEYFFTQTLNSNYNRYDLNNFKKIIQTKFKAYKRKYPNFKYLIIYEKHKDGAYHLHGLVSGLGLDVYRNSNGYLSLNFFEDLGFNSLSKIKDTIRVAHYITKYISKNMEKCDSGYSYFHSQGLKTATRTALDFESYKVYMKKIYENDFIKKYERVK